ncbi:MAG: hypothetical protein A2Y12_15155 [Planctomycetes bacterium GWF2_42_9]|nr:MAG: hypothetical protein A2Y12_15155 [Planctomycetes bacterium GWF2_42_9]
MLDVLKNVNVFWKGGSVMCKNVSLCVMLLSLCTGTVMAGYVGNAGYTYTYSWNVAQMHPGPGTTPGTDAYTELNTPSILNDGEITEDSDIAAWPAVPCYQLNGELDNGTFFGPSNGGQITFDLGSAKALAEVIIHMNVHTAHGVGVITDVNVTIDGGAPFRISGLGVAPGNNVVRTCIMNLTGYTGQVVTLKFVAGCSEWTSFSEVEFYQPGQSSALTVTPGLDVRVLAGQTATLSVTAQGGGGNYNYQWKKDGVNLTNTGKVSGATTNTLVITDVDFSFENSNYTCHVTSGGNSTGIDAGPIALDVAVVPTLTDYGKRILATDPVAYYSFDEGSGNTALEIVSKNLKSILTSVDPLHTAHGIYGSAVDTSAGNTNVHPDRTKAVWGNTNTGISAVAGAHAVEWMMRWNGSANTGDNAYPGGNIVGAIHDNVSVDFRDFDSPPTGNMGLVVNNNIWHSSYSDSFSTNIMASAANPNFQQWHHFVFVDRNQPGLCDLYIDGVKRAGFGWKTATDMPGEMILSTIRVGGWADPDYGRSFDGEIDEVAWYDLSGASNMDAAGAAIASHAVVTGAAYVAQSPLDATVEPAGTAEFRCVAAGAPTISYQWKKGGVNLVNGSNVSGADGPILTLSNVGFELQGQKFTCAVSNGQGSAISGEATLHITCYWDIQGDLNADCKVDFKDFAILAQHWLEDSSTPAP